MGPEHTARRIGQIFLSHFALCAFFGLFTLEAILITLGAWDRADDAQSLKWLPVVASGNGLLVALAVWLTHSLRLEREAQDRLVFWPAPKGRDLRIAVGVGFFCGFLDLLVWAPGGVAILTVMVIAVLIVHVRKFLRTVVRMLAPDSSATWEDVGELFHVYLTVLAAFSLMVVTAAAIRVYFPEMSPAFAYPGTEGPASFLDAFYFSVVVMTTLGFGDIHPVSLDAKLLVAVQCLVSYIMFALMIGSITRGISRRHDRRE